MKQVAIPLYFIHPAELIAIIACFKWNLKKDRIF